MIARRLTGSRCLCRTCGEYFNSVTAFDRHRVGTWRDRGAWRRCLEPSEMVARGWSLNALGFWVTETRANRQARVIRRGLPPIGGDQVQPWA